MHKHNRSRWAARKTGKVPLGKEQEHVSHTISNGQQVELTSKLSSHRESGGFLCKKVNALQDQHGHVLNPLAIVFEQVGSGVLACNTC